MDLTFAFFPISFVFLSHLFFPYYLCASVHFLIFIGKLIKIFGRDINAFIKMIIELNQIDISFFLHRLLLRWVCAHKHKHKHKHIQKAVCDARNMTKKSINIQTKELT